MSLLAHRGPDGCGVWRDGDVELGHTRLAIIDLSDSGRQPMLSGSQSAVITFNGEVYNFKALRSALVSAGHHFVTSSDTEVILALYETYGIEGFRQIDGMFAAAIWDRRSRELILARDPMGKKPLYYSDNHHGFGFASELKALLALTAEQPSIREGSIEEYLSFGFIGGNRTVYEGIEEVKPGDILVLGAGGETKTFHYADTFVSQASASGGIQLDDLKEILTAAVEKRMLASDVPVGILLSGGIDSALVTAYAAKVIGTKLPTFTLGFSGSADERAAARTVSEHFQTDHHELVLEPEIEKIIEKVAAQYDEPYGDASAIPTFYLCDYTSKHVKVALTGDGGDELFGGYRRHLAAKWLDSITRIVSPRVLSAASSIVSSALPAPQTVGSGYGLIHRLTRVCANDSDARLRGWFTDGFAPAELMELGHERAVPLTNPFRDIGPNEQLFDYLVNADVLWHMPGEILVKTDIAAMAYGLEARSPFLDRRMVGLSQAMSIEQKVRGTTTKWMLRELAKDAGVPPAICAAPKRGFEMPIARWLSNELRALTHDLLLARDGIVSRMFKRSKVERWLNQPTASAARHAQLTWMLLMLSAWDRFGLHRHRHIASN